MSCNCVDKNCKCDNKSKIYNQNFLKNEIKTILDKMKKAIKDENLTVIFNLHHQLEILADS